MAQNEVPSLNKSGSALKTKTEHTQKIHTKKNLYHQPVQMIKKMAGQEPKDMTIKTIKSAHDDKSCLSMSVSQDIGRIPRKKKKESIRNFNHRE